MRQGTIVDPNLIAAPSSTINKTGSADAPEKDRRPVVFWKEYLRGR